MFKSDRCSFDHKDKYAGRGLTTSVEFIEALKYFLHDGTRLLVELVSTLIEKLDQLYQLVKNLQGYRFYGSSLLVCYDGLDVSTIDVRLIDFARCVTRQEMREHAHLMSSPPSIPMSPDQGYLTGLQSIIQALETILQE